MITTKHDTKLNIATARNRFDKVWKNNETSWGKLLERLSQTVKTFETQSEYLSFGKDRQDEIKDVGGFVGGHLKDGKRKNGYVLNRQILTLDVDFADRDFWENLKVTNDYAICCYSTHKHKPSNPRLRLIFPLNRPVSAEEYEAIGRKVAEEIGIDYFDDTTYQATRLMYWPSTSKDGEFFFDYMDLPIMDADEVLKKYPDWTDVSFWPESSRASGIRNKSASKQGDPLMKDGLIGAFCRTYSIQEAIHEFLSDTYHECRDDRYTYVNGSTAGGLVIYKDKFAYSNHGSDPVSGMLCNAFDLVRIHKFGELDEDAKEGTPVNKKPSWTAMMDFISKNEEVKKTLGLERVAKSIDDFKDKLVDNKGEIKADEYEWLKSLTATKGGGYEVTINNFLLILENDPKLKGIGGLNLFSGIYEVLSDLPWERSTINWTDSDDANVRYYIEHMYSMKNTAALKDAIDINFSNRAFNPVKDYLESLEWDEVKRIETVLIDYLGANDSKYVRDVTRKTLTAAVKRIYQPGCKFDQMLTLVGKQGEGKSTIWRLLGMKWYSDTLVDVKGKEAYESLDDVWIMEMGELAAAKKGDRESIKMFLSKGEDRYRKAYDKRTTINKRQCIIVGTTNDQEFLKDATGNRRFWIVETKKENARKDIFEELDSYEIDQIWAEAVLNYRTDKENVMVLDEDSQRIAIELQEAHEESNSLKGQIEEYLSLRIPEDWMKMTINEQRQWYLSTEDYKELSDINLVERERVCTLEVWCVLMGKDKADGSNYQCRGIAECLDRIDGWERESNSSRYGKYGTQRTFKKAKKS